MKKENVGGSLYEIEIYDKNGKLIKKERKKGDSILKNWMFLFYGMANGVQWSFYDTNGNLQEINSVSVISCSLLAPSGDDSFGIIVGSGTTPVDLEDHNLASKIPNGTGSGQLSYGETSFYSSYNGLTYDMGGQRSFDNNSGADITINEIGLVMKVNDGSNNYYVLIMRDVISASTVPNGGRITIKYWFRWNPS